LIKDAPPQGSGGMIVGYGSFGGSRPHESAGVETSLGEVAQSFCQLRQEWICGHTWDFRGEQLPPSPRLVGSRSGESLVELVLPGSRGIAELEWPGWSQVAGVDLGGGAPYLQVGDELGRHGSMALARPANTIGGEPDLVGELSNQA
jgi:hypothetical protein